MCIICSRVTKHCHLINTLTSQTRQFSTRARTIYRMNDKVSFSGWIRPPGPVNIWQIIESQRKLEDGTMQPIRISIQELPEDRKEEALQFMFKYFIPEEPTCKSLNIVNDPQMLQDFNLMWKLILEGGIVEAAYIIDSNNQILELASVNMLYVWTKENDNAFMDFCEKQIQSEKFRRSLVVLMQLSKKADCCEILGVDKYISADGLVVAPHLRGQKLGLHMINAREVIGKKYGISASSTIFTAPASQISAERAGYEVKLTQDYADIFDGQGKPLFPNIEAKNLKVMMKRLY